MDWNMDLSFQYLHLRACQLFCIGIELSYTSSNMVNRSLYDVGSGYISHCDGST